MAHEYPGLMKIDTQVSQEMPGRLPTLLLQKKTTSGSFWAFLGQKSASETKNEAF